MRRYLLALALLLVTVAAIAWLAAVWGQRAERAWARITGSGARAAVAGEPGAERRPYVRPRRGDLFDLAERVREVGDRAGILGEEPAPIDRKPTDGEPIQQVPVDQAAGENP